MRTTMRQGAPCATGPAGRANQTSRPIEPRQPLSEGVPATAQAPAVFSCLCGAWALTRSSPQPSRAQHAAGDRPAVDLGGAVVDAEGADVAEEAGDDRVVGDAEPAEDLHAAV